MANGYESAEANQGGQFEQLPAGGYICKIKSVEDVQDRQYLKIEYDITDGPKRGWYTEIFKRTGKWYGQFCRSYKDSAVGFFKGFITAIVESNPGYKWEWAEQTLINKNIGLVLAYEEFINKDNNLRERVYVAQNRSTAAIKAGDFTVPELKRLKEANAPKQAQGDAMRETNTKMPWDD
jgi:hypothetical protein